jgi:hypothetical protein
MPPKRRDPEAVAAAVAQVLTGSYERTDLALAVRGLAEQLAAAAPGHHVEARIPPYSAVQCVAGPRHTSRPSRWPGCSCAPAGWPGPTPSPTGG